MVTHTRIRKFNTKESFPELALDNDMCQAVRAGNTVFVRGQVGQTFDHEIVGVGDVAAQTQQAMENIDILLKESGSEMSHVCKLIVYLVDPRHREAVYQTIGPWFKGVYPVSTCVVVSMFTRPEFLVEIDVTAVVP